MSHIQPKEREREREREQDFCECGYRVFEIETSRDETNAK